MGRRRVVLSIVWWSHPSPPLLDSSESWNDEMSGGSQFSYESLMPAAAGTPSYENGVGWWRRLGAVRATPATPLDSGFRRNDETGRSNGCHLFSYE